MQRTFTQDPFFIPHTVTKDETRAVKIHGTRRALWLEHIARNAWGEVYAQWVRYNGRWEKIGDEIRDDC